MTSMFIRILIALFLVINCTSVYAAVLLQEFSETTISGTIRSAGDNQPIPNVSFTAQGRITDKVTDSNGNFELTINQEPPFLIRITAPGYKMKEIEISAKLSTNLDIRLEQANEVEISEEESDEEVNIVEIPKVIEEEAIKVPLPIEKLNYSDIENSPTGDYYKALSNLKGIDFTANSILFPVINSRGFNSTANHRVLQLTDGMDMQSPAFNFAIGKLLSPSELDVANIEFIAGPYSALYGPNAYNGVLSVQSKDPFEYQGLSLRIGSGLNYLEGNPAVGEPADPQSSFKSSIRFARAFNDRFAFKLNVSFRQAQDWQPNIFNDQNRILQGSRVTNPARDEVHAYGDEEILNIRSLLSDPATRRILISSLSSQSDIDVFDVLQYVSILPSQPVTRTGYPEHYLVDYGVDNLKTNAAFHYRINDSVKAEYQFNFGSGTTSYTGSRRVSLKNISISQHMVELNSDHLNLKAYATFENSGDSYFVDLLGSVIHESYSPNTEWLSLYGSTYLGELFNAAVDAQNGNPNFNFSTIQALLRDPSMVSQFNSAARNAADENRFIAGSEPFNSIVDMATQNTLPDGVFFKNKSRLYHAEARYNFKNLIEFADVKAGLRFRQIQLQSDGTLFDDNGGRNIHEWGGFLTGFKSLFSESLNVTASVSFDKHQNFNGLFSPSVITVYRLGKDQYLRGSFRTGFSTPTVQSQYLNSVTINSRVLGGLSHIAERYNLDQNTYTLESVYNYQNAFLAGNAFAEDKLLPFTFKPVQPEQIRTIEVGYRGLLSNSFVLDAAYYYNIYKGFNSLVTVRQINSDLNNNGAIEESEIFHITPNTNYFLFSGDELNTFHVYTNIDHTLESHGLVLGMDYNPAGNFNIGFNYNWNSLISNLSGLRNEFNTPKHKINLIFGNPRFSERFGFNFIYRWQNAFRWESSFTDQDVEAVSTFDAQFSYYIPQYNASFKIGGSNIFNNQQRLSGGGPTISAFYYVSLTLNEIFR